MHSVTGGVTFIRPPPNIVVQARQSVNCCRPAEASGCRTAGLGPDHLIQCRRKSRSFGLLAGCSRDANWVAICSADIVAGDPHWAEVPRS